jgi:hypothetical protein
MFRLKFKAVAGAAGNRADLALKTEMMLLLFCNTAKK